MSAASYFDDTKNHTTSLIFNNCYTDWRGFQIQNKTILISICILIFRPLWCIFDRYIKHQFIETFNYQNLYISRLIYHLLVAKIIIIKSWKSSFFTLNKQLINMYDLHQRVKLSRPTIKVRISWTIEQPRHIIHSSNALNLDWTKLSIWKWNWLFFLQCISEYIGYYYIKGAVITNFLLKFTAVCNIHRNIFRT